MSQPRSPLMFPGQWEPRRPQRANPAGAVEALPGATPPATAEATRPVLHVVPTGQARSAPEANSVVAEWPSWVKPSLMVGVLLVVTIAVMWGESLAR